MGIVGTWTQSTFDPASRGTTDINSSTQKQSIPNARSGSLRDPHPASAWGGFRALCGHAKPYPNTANGQGHKSHPLVLQLPTPSQDCVLADLRNANACYNCRWALPFQRQMARTHNHSSARQTLSQQRLNPSEGKTGKRRPAVARICRGASAVNSDNYMASLLGLRVGMAHYVVLWTQPS